MRKRLYTAWSSSGGWLCAVDSGFGLLWRVGSVGGMSVAR